MPLKSKIGGPVRYVKDRENMCSTADQARYIYKKEEQESIVNLEMIKEEIEDERLDENNNNIKEVNPDCNIIIDEFDTDNIIASQMEQWSILSNTINYVQYERNPRDFYNLDVKAIDQKHHRKIYDRLRKKIDRL